MYTIHTDCSLIRMFRAEGNGHFQEIEIMCNANNSQDGHHRFSGEHYVVSEDIDILIERWCSSTGFLSPGEKFYSGLRSNMKSFLQDIFARVTFISSQEIRKGLLESIARHKKAGLTVISLERAYLEDNEINGRIEVTRTVNDWGDDILILGARNGTPPKRIQFERFRDKKIALIDDVVFSGKTVAKIINELHYSHANVHAISAAIGVKDGVDHLKEMSFGIIGMPDSLDIECLEEFDDISDQICERDFYPGVPYSGRQHCGSDLASFPYILPFGKPVQWASIPEKKINQFSRLCLANTIGLFEEIERINGLTISCSMIPRPIFGFPKDKTPFISFLKEQHASLKGKSIELLRM